MLQRRIRVGEKTEQAGTFREQDKMARREGTTRRGCNARSRSVVNCACKTRARNLLSDLPYDDSLDTREEASSHFGGLLPETLILQPGECSATCVRGVGRRPSKRHGTRGGDIR